MLDFIAFDPKEASRKSSVAVAKLLASCDENGEPWDQTSFPELPDALFWTRQALAVLFGLICGVIPFTGWIGIIVWAVLVMGPPVLYQQTYLDVDWAPADAEKDDGIAYQWTKLAQEGMMPSFGTFLLFWVLAFVAVHPGLDLGEQAAAAAAAATASA